MRQRPHNRSGQAAIEFALLYAGVLLPLTMGIVYMAELLWVWHSVADYTREGARYAATHCWQPGGDNVRQYMTTHIPKMIDMEQFRDGPAQIIVDYFTVDPASGARSEFTCDGGECSVNCVPDGVTVRIQSYEFRRFVTYLRLPPVPLPNFQASVPIESAGCDPEQGTCLP